MTNNDNGQVVTLTEKTRRKIRWGLTAIIVCSVLIGLTAGVFVTYKIVSKPAKRPQKFSLHNYLQNAELVWSDEFDGDALDEGKWTVQKGENGEPLPRRGGYWTSDAVSVSDGKLTIKTYKGADGGFYTGAVQTDEKYESKYGYYEARCKLPKAYGIWSAFWLMPGGGLMETENPDSAVAGAEIDVFESPAYPYDIVQQAIHVGGYGNNHRSAINLKWLVTSYGNVYDEFHTYGVFWSEDIYIFYVDGQEVWKTSMNENVSKVAEYLILSVEVGGNVVDGVPTPGNAWGNPLFKSPDTDANDWTTSADFVIDYVRHYRLDDNTEYFYGD